MLKKLDKRQIGILIFLGIEFVLFILNNWIFGLIVKDYRQEHVIYGSYFFILFNFAFSLIFSRKKNLIHLGLFFTCIADLFLTFLKTPKLELGVTFFLVVQLIYFSSILIGQSKTEILINISIRIILSIVIGITAKLIFKENTSYLIVITGIYALNIVLNAVNAFIKFKSNKLLAIALIFFIYCDLCVGINAMNSLGMIILDDLKVLDNIVNWNFFGKAQNVTWIMYIPSQTLIALFSISKNNNSNCKQ